VSNPFVYPADLRSPPNVPALNRQFEALRLKLVAFAQQGLFEGTIIAPSFYLVDDQSPPHYWKLSITSAGALVTTDSGTTKPTS